MKEEPVDPSLCPLCSGPNECVMVNGGQSCWCFSSPIAREAIEKVPVQARGLACICSKCGSSFSANTESNVQGLNTRPADETTPH